MKVILIHQYFMPSLSESVSGRETDQACCEDESWREVRGGRGGGEEIFWREAGTEQGGLVQHRLEYLSHLEPGGSNI